MQIYAGRVHARQGKNKKESPCGAGWGKVFAGLCGFSLHPPPLSCHPHEALCPSLDVKLHNSINGDKKEHIEAIGSRIT